MDNLHPGERRPEAGEVWNGFEWVSPTRYDQLRATTMPELPPMQLVHGERGGETVLPRDIAANLLAGFDENHRAQQHAQSEEMRALDVAIANALDALDAFVGKVQRVPASSLERAYHLYPISASDPALGEWLAQKLAMLDTAGIEEPAVMGAGWLRATAIQEPAFNYHPHTLNDDEKEYKERKITKIVRRLLRQVEPIMRGEPLRGGLEETPERAAKAWMDWTSGYYINPADVLKQFEDGAEECDEMVVVRNIPVYSHCEHHLAPIVGTATVGYLPNKRIVGLSKLNRLVDIFARRLQVQERMTNQIATAMQTHLQPRGCGVVITARHMCMESRGVRQPSDTVTSALRGMFKDDPTVRAEFLALARES